MSTKLRLSAPVVLPCDSSCSVLRDAVVDIDANGRVVHSGPSATAAALPPGATTRQLDGVLVPGLINAHAHSPMSLLRGMGGELPLLRWLREVIWPAESRLRFDDVRAGMALGAVEMLRAGVTTSAEMYFPGEAVASGVLDVGSRAVLAPGIISAPEISQLSGTPESMIAGIDRWIDTDGLRFGPGQRIELSYGPHSAYTLPAAALEEVAAAAQHRDALVQIHVAETPDEDAAQRAEYGSVPLLLEQMGLLRGRVLAAHGVHLSDGDIEVFARNAVGLAHCPGSNAKLASGTARLPELLSAGVRVGLGTDGPSSNDDLDVWEEIRLAALLARLSTKDATALPASVALLAATREGAAALGRDDLGALTPGCWADVVHMDVDNPAFVAGTDIPDEELLADLVWAAGSRCVRDVWVAGDQVLDDGEPTWTERARVQARARESADHVRGR